MLDFIKKIFNSTTDEGLTEQDLFSDTPVIENECNTCDLKNKCITKTACDEGIIPELKDIDQSKDTLLIIDDNEGVISFLSDDIEYFFEENIIKKNKINVLTITSSNAAFILRRIYDRKININIKWAIIDITLGGSKMTTEGNIKLTGVDVFEDIYNNTENKDDFKYIFYTGNNLNPYIKSNEKLINQFKNITKKNIKKFVLFKTAMDIPSRRSYIAKYLFNKDIG